MNTGKVVFKTVQRVSDGGVGYVGQLAPYYEVRAEWGAQRGTRAVEGSQVSLRLGYWFTFWNNPQYPVKAGMIANFNGQDYTVQSVEFTDELNRRVKVIALATNGG